MLALTFSVGESRYAVDVRRVVEVVPRIDLQPVPSASGCIAGMFDHAGTVVPVVDLGCLLGKEPCPRRLSTRIVLVESPQAGSTGLIGLVAEHVTELRELPDDDGSPAPVATSAGAALGPIVSRDDGLIQILRVDALGRLLGDADDRGAQ